MFRCEQWKQGRKTNPLMFELFRFVISDHTENKTTRAFFDWLFFFLFSIRKRWKTKIIANRIEIAAEAARGAGQKVIRQRLVSLCLPKHSLSIRRWYMCVHTHVRNLFGRLCVRVCVGEAGIFKFVCVYFYSRRFIFADRRILSPDWFVFFYNFKENTRYSFRKPKNALKRFPKRKTIRKTLIRKELFPIFKMFRVK